MRKIITEYEIKKFKRYLLKAEKSLNTIEKYMCDIRKLQKYVQKKALTKQLLLQYKKQLEEQGQYKISSINSFITAINSFCTAMNWKELCIKTIRVQRTAFETEEKELTMQEYKRMVCIAIEQGHEQTALIIQTLAGTGIRVSELKYINVECLESGVVDVYNKGKVRRILLPSALQIILKKYAQEQNKESGIIFQNKRKQPIDRREVWYKIKKAAAAAHVPQSKAFPHNLRHLFAKQFYEQTGDIAKLADVLGHGSIETTRLYIRSTGKEHKQQLDMMNMIFDNNDKNAQNQEDNYLENENKTYTENENLIDITTFKNKYKLTKNINHDIQHTLKIYRITMTEQNNIQPVYNNKLICINDTNICNIIADIRKTRLGIIIAPEFSFKALPSAIYINVFQSLKKSNLKELYKKLYFMR